MHLANSSLDVGLRTLQVEPYLSGSHRSALRGGVPSSHISQFEVTAQRRQYNDMLLRVAIQSAGRSTVANNVFQPDTLSAMLPPELFPGYVNPRTTNDLISGGSTECLVKVALFMVSNALVKPNQESATRVLQWFETQRDCELIKLLISRNDSTSDALVENLFHYAILAENVAVLRVLPKRPLLLDSPHPWLQFMSPLQYACKHQNLELVSILIDAGATVVDLSLDQVLHSIHDEQLGHGRIQVDLDLVHLLLESGASTCSCVYMEKHPIQPKSAAGWASYLDDVQLVNLLLEGRWNVNPCNECLREAVARVNPKGRDSKSILRLLLNAGAKIPLSTAIRCQSTDIMKQLLEVGATFSHDDLAIACEQDSMEFILDALDQYHSRKRNTKSYWANPPLHDSASDPSFNDAYQISVHDQPVASQCTVDPTGESRLGRFVIASILALPEETHQRCLDNCLRSAVEAGSESVARALINAGAAVDEGLLSLAITVGTPELISIFLDGPMRDIPWNQNDIMTAVERGDVVLVKQLLDAGSDVNATRYQTSNNIPVSTLSTAILAGKPDMVSCMLEHGADINNPHMVGDGVTALEAAVKAGNEDLVHQLLHFGANAYDDQALLAAVSAGYAMVHILLTACSPQLPYRKAGFGCSALQLAIGLQDISIVRLLLDNGVPVNEYPNCHSSGDVPGRHFVSISKTALETAIITDRGQDLNILKMVLHALGDPNRLIGKFGSKSTALLHAIRHSNHGAVDLLLAKGADANARAVRGCVRTPLQAAVEQGNMDLVQNLLLLSADVNALPAKIYGATALQLAARNGFVAIARLLLSVGADVNAPGSAVGGRTALEEAAANGRIDMIHLLVHARAQLQGPGSKFERAKNLATEGGYHAARRFLESLHAEQTAFFGLNFENDLSEQWARADEEQEVTGHDHSRTTLSSEADVENSVLENDIFVVF